MTVARQASTTSVENDEGAGRTLIRWSAVFAGTLLGLATLALLSSLWLALARASSVDMIARNIEWFIGVSAVVCLFLAGLLAGYLSGVRGAGTGFLHGATIWALLLLVTLSVGVPAILNVFSLGQLSRDVQTTTTTTDETVFNALWGTFWTNPRRVHRRGDRRGDRWSPDARCRPHRACGRRDHRPDAHRR